MSLVFVCLITPHKEASALDQSNAPAPRRLKIITANLFLDNKRPLNATQAIAQEAPDIIILVEWTGRNADAELLLARGYSFIVNEPRRGTWGIAMLAKAELSASGGVIEPPVRGPCRMPFGILSFALAGQKIALLGIHAPPPIAACNDTTRPTLEAIGAWVEDGRLAADITPAAKGQWIILAGDFNARPSDKAIQGFADRGLVDTYSKSDSLYEPTWSPYVSGPRIVRIDYIFVPREFSVMSHRAVRLPGSDHSAVTAEIAIKARSSAE